jgi:hypothetical protein
MFPQAKTGIQTTHKDPEGALPSSDTAAMLFSVHLASGQIVMRKIDGQHTLTAKYTDRPLDVAA